MRTTAGTFLAILMLFGAAQISVSGQEKTDGYFPEPIGQSIQRSIEGVWRTSVTLRNCQTGLPVAPAIKGLFTFHNGGTMSEYGIGPGQTPALRSPGHGIWQRENGFNDYSFKFIMYRYDASGGFIGSQKGTASLVLNSDGFTNANIINTTSTVEIFDANDKLIGTGCATAVGRRFE